MFQAFRPLGAGSNALNRLARVREPADQLAAALCAPLDLALARKPREVLPLALADGMATIVA
jgi:hypothetical protein